MSDAINIGGIYADLEIDSGKLEQGLSRGRAAMAMIEREMRALQEDWRRQAIGVDEVTARLDKLGKEYGELSARMQAAYAAVGTSANPLDVANKSMQYGFANSGRACP